MNITPAMKSWLVENGFAQKSWTDSDDWLKAMNKAIGERKLSAEKTAELLDVDLELIPKGGTGLTGKGVFGGVNVKQPSERYSNTKSVAKHVRSGQPVHNERGQLVENLSELETVKAGVLLKKFAQRSGQPVVLDEHEKQLFGEMLETDLWCGKVGSEYKTGISGLEVKALLNDATSGGQEVVPVWFDDALITFPLLHSELLPRVDLRDVPRGSKVEGASVGNPTVTWGTGEGTALTPFDTAGIVQAIDTSIFPVTVAIEIGRDFLNDSAAEVGRVLVENIGQKLLQELDRVIVIGNGTSEPQGILNASGIIDIGNPAGGAGAVPEIDDYEALMFSIGKQYRNPSMRCCFIANDRTYSRARGIPVGAADARRVFGMDHGSYRLLEHDFAIQNGMSNPTAVFGAMAKYRLYRRQGQEVRFTSEGKELALKNLTLLVVRGRYGGKVVDPNAFSFSDNFQA